jgi:hypothetical protein
MVLSDKEITILQSVADGIRNTTGYGYQVMVHGTQFNGVVQLVCGLLSIILTLVVTKWVILPFTRGIYIAENKDPWVYLVGVIAVGVLFALISCVVWCVLYNPLINILAPEYVVVNNILNTLTTAASVK